MWPLHSLCGRHGLKLNRRHGQKRGIEHRVCPLLSLDKLGKLFRARSRPQCPFSSILRAAASFSAMPASVRMQAPSVRHNSRSSPFFSPCSTSIRLFHLKRIADGVAERLVHNRYKRQRSFPASLPTAVRFSAKLARIVGPVFINEPLPDLTSRTITSAPAASFLLMMELTMSGMLATVPVTSRRA